MDIYPQATHAAYIYVLISRGLQGDLQRCCLIIMNKINVSRGIMRQSEIKAAKRRENRPCR